jgi:carboxyl-terminal processing protease
MNRSYDRLKKITQDDQFNEYVKTITESMDPHTTFMRPSKKDLSMKPCGVVSLVSVHH